MRNGHRIACRGLALALAAVAFAGCVTQPSAAPTPTATARATTAGPRFELATYMYALQTKGRIRVGVLDADAPFAATDASGAHAGFEVDLARELAKAIFGARPDPDAVIEWISVDRSTALSALTSAQADVVLARLAATTERAAVIDQTDPYFVTGERVLVQDPNDEINDLPDLDSKTVCVTAGTGVGADVEDANAYAKILTLDTYASCLDALRHSQVDAIAAAETTLWALRRDDAKTKIVGRPLTTERYAIGAKKNAGGDRIGFAAFLSDWLAGAIRDGTWARLYEKDITPLSGDRKTSPAQ